MLSRFLRLVRRILRRACEVLIGHLQVVFPRDQLGIADPRRHHMEREALSQLRLACASEVLEQPGPGFQSSLADDALELGPKIAVPSPIAGDNIAVARLGFSEDLVQVGGQFGE